MQDHYLVLGSKASRFNLSDHLHDIFAHLGWIHAVMASIERSDQLCKDAPDKFFLGILVGGCQVLDDLTQVSTTAILHVDVEVLRGLEVLPMIVGHNVWVAQRAQDRELGM